MTTFYLAGMFFAQIVCMAMIVPVMRKREPRRRGREVLLWAVFIVLAVWNLNAVFRSAA